MIEIYVDGAGSNQKTLCGGWAYVVLEENKVLDCMSGGAQNTTNNRMELQALLEAMKRYYNKENVVYYCDSAYVVNCLEQKWFVNWRNNGWKTAKKTAVVNRDLWEEIIELYDSYNLTVKKVKGHSDCYGNQLADKFAVHEKKIQEEQLNCQK